MGVDLDEDDEDDVLHDTGIDFMPEAIYTSWHIIAKLSSSPVKFSPI